MNISAVGSDQVFTTVRSYKHCLESFETTRSNFLRLEKLFEIARFCYNLKDYRAFDNKTILKHRYSCIFYEN